MWQFTVAPVPFGTGSNGKAKTKKKTKKAGVWMLPGGGEELGLCQVNQLQLLLCPPPLRPEAKANLTPQTLPPLTHTHAHGLQVGGCSSYLRCAHTHGKI